MTLFHGTVADEAGNPLEAVAVSNGEQIVLTDSRGKFELQADPALHPFIFVTRPDGYIHGTWYCSTAGSGRALRFVLAPLPNSQQRTGRQTVYLAQITDLHLVVKGSSGAEKVDELRRDLQAVIEAAPDVDLVVATGDLTNYGDLASLQALGDIFSHFDRPVALMFGGHDGNEERRDNPDDRPWTRNWQQTIGPLYYSLDLGGWHIVVCPDEDSYFGPEHAAIKQRWLTADMELARKAGKRILLARHTPPSNEAVEFLANQGVEVVLFGHWHSSKCYRYRSVTVLGTPPLVFGGIDFMPRGFRVIRLGPGKPQTQYIALQSSRHPVLRERGSGMLRIGWARATKTHLHRGEPLVSDHDVFIPVPDEEGRGRAGVLCLALEDGHRRWFAPTADSVRGSLDAAAGLLFAVTQTGEVVALDQATGRRVWSQKLDHFPDRWIYTGPAVAADVVIAGTGGGGLQAFDLTTGQQRWSWGGDWKCDVWSQYATPLAIGDRVVVMLFRKGAYCLDAHTGETLWCFDCNYEYLLAPMLFTGSAVLVPAHPARLHALDPQTGGLLWTRQAAGDVIAWNCAHNLLVANTQEGPTECRRVGSGRLRWRYEHNDDLLDMVPYRRAIRSAVAKPLVTSRGVLVAGADGIVKLLDARTGTARDTLDVGAPVVASAMGPDETVILTTWDGRIIRLDIAAM